MKGAILPSLFSSVVGLMSSVTSQPKSSGSDNLAAERAAREEEQRQEEAEERKRARDKTLEAREMEKKLDDTRRATLLATGGSGLTDQAEVSSAQLKKTLGE